MLLLGFGAPIALLGVTMMIRGWVYTLRPEGGMAKKRQKVNLKRGFTTDMKVFGRKVRRLGLMLALAGATMVGWHFSQDQAPSSVGGSAPAAAPVAP